MPTAAWSMPVATQNRITRSCAFNFVVAFAIDLLPPPALAKRGHGSLARRFISVRWGAVFVVAEGQYPHPMTRYGRGLGREDAATTLRYDL
jgi:hypothetical protein